MSRKISIITPCFNEEANIEDCYTAVRDIFRTRLPNNDVEHIFCDNASTDRTPQLLRAIAKSDSTVKVVINARNYGPFRSVFNGLQYATGDAVIVLLAADLQDPPEVIPEMVRKWESGFEVVYGVRTNRQEGLILRNVRKLYYRTVNRLADISIPLDAGEFQLIDRVVLEALLENEDYYPYIRGMIANCGFRSIGVEYVWKARAKGFSKNRLYHLIDQGINGLISFTNVPMRLCMLIGALIACTSFLYTAFTLAINLFHSGKLAAPGIPTLIVAIFFFAGVQLMFLGVIGEYVAAIHQQVRKRPLVVERERINCV